MATGDKKITQLPKAASTAKDGVYAIVDPITLQTVQQAIQAGLGASRANMDWQSDTEYDEDDFVLYNGLTAWQSLQNSNTGNVPAENTWWTAITISPADGITDTQWQAGLFTYDDSKVIYQNTSYFLQDAAPFESTNIADEITAGNWLARVIIVHTHINAGWDAFSGSTSVTNWLFGYITFESAITPAGGQTLGTADVAYGAHVYFVLGASSTDMVIRVTGTVYDDVTGRDAGATSDVDTSGGSTDDYFETPEKFIGQVDITLLSGSGVTTDYGWVTYYDNQNTEFILNALEWTGRAGANDTGPNISIWLHTNTGWTYDGAGALLAPPIIDMQTEYNTEFEIATAQHFKFKMTGLTTTIRGDLSEGIIVGIDITQNNAISSSNIELTKTDQ